MPKKIKDTIPIEAIVSKIIYLRGVRALLDRDLAEMYGVETRVLKQAVRRNSSRFPDDFKFELTKKEQASLRSQIVILKRGQHSKYPPFAFTEQGVAMLSSVLNSQRAIEVNITIMRAFVQLRRMLSTHTELAQKLRELQEKLENHDEQILAIFEAIKLLIEKNEEPGKKIGYIKEQQGIYGY